MPNVAETSTGEKSKSAVTGISREGIQHRQRASAGKPLVFGHRESPGTCPKAEQTDWTPL